MFVQNCTREDSPVISVVSAWTSPWFWLIGIGRPTNLNRKRPQKGPVIWKEMELHREPNVFCCRMFKFSNHKPTYRTRHQLPHHIWHLFDCSQPVSPLHDLLLYYMTTDRLPNRLLEASRSLARSLTISHAIFLYDRPFYFPPSVPVLLIQTYSQLQSFCLLILSTLLYFTSFLWALTKSSKKPFHEVLEEKKKRPYCYTATRIATSNESHCPLAPR